MSALVRSSPRDGLIDHNGPACQQHAEKCGDVGRSVAQQHADLTAAFDERFDPPGEPGKVGVARPLTVVFDSGCVGREVQNAGDPLPQRVLGHHRILGSGFTGPPRAASSAVPIGLPSLV